MSLFRKKAAPHESGNTHCPECPKDWPREHKNCGGLYHAISRVKPGETLRAAKCDKCGQMLELLIGNIGSSSLRPEKLANALSEAERLAFEKVTGDKKADGDAGAGEHDVKDLVFVVPQEPPRPIPTFDDEGSVFAGKNIDYCIEKLYDYVHHPNSSIATHIAEFGWAGISNALRDFEAKVRSYGANPENSQFPTALFAAVELQQYISKQKCSIEGETEARIYIQSLEHDLDDLRRWERDLDEDHANPAV